MLLLSLEEGHPSMGKMAGANRNCSGGRGRWGFQGVPKAGELCVGQSMEKRLEKHYGLAEAGVEVIVDGVEKSQSRSG
jgi:hypothetical protein